MMGRISVKWWAQQATIAVVEVPVEVAVISDEFLTITGFFICFLRCVYKPICIPNPPESNNIQYHKSLNCEIVAVQLFEEIPITTK